MISDPELTLTRRSKKDKFIILASDGLWDVMTPRYAGQVTHKCLKKRQTKGDGSSRAPLPENNERPSRSAYAAALLTRLALARHTADNLTVVVVDLKRTTNTDANNSNALIA